MRPRAAESPAGPAVAGPAGARRGLKLSGKMTLFFIALVLSQSLVTLSILTAIISRTNLDSLKSRMADTVLSLEGYLGETFSDLRVKGDLIAGQQKTVDYADFRLKNLLARELALYKESLGIESLAVFLDTEAAFATTTDLAPGDSFFRERLAASLAGERALFLSHGAGGTSLFVLSPIRRDGRIIGALSLSLGLDQAFVDRVEKIVNARVALSFEDLSVHDDSLTEAQVRTIGDAIARASGTTGPVEAGPFLAGVVDLSTLGLTGGSAWCLMDRTEYDRQIGRYNAISLLATLAILFLALATGLLFYQRTFLRRFQTILRGITHISRGDFNPPFRLAWQDEFGQLAAAFDDMCRKLLVRDQQLSQLFRYNTLVLDGVRSGIVSVSLAGEVTAFNRAARRILETGSTDPRGTSLESGIIPADLLPVFHDSLKEAFASGVEVAVRCAGGPRTLAVASSPLLSQEGERIGVVVIFEDVTREKSLEEKLALSARLAALGEMAAGVAHQVRNPLVVMKVSAEMLRDGFSVQGDEARYRKLTHLIVDEIDALNLVISNFLDFARPRKLQRTISPVRAMVEFALESLPVDRFPGIAIRTVIPDDVDGHPMDSGLMSQALANLVLNALQASASGNAVEIRARREGGQLTIEVEDWGTGMDEATRRLIFNPFFTTRDSGTGLGLSIAHRIIEEHGGAIDVRSRPGDGATFCIRI